MTNVIEKALRSLEGKLSGCLSVSGEDIYEATTAIWAKPIGPMPRAVVHCRTHRDVQLTIRAARECDLALSVRGGGHDWAGRALCDGIVLDLSGMRNVIVVPEMGVATIKGGARASDVLSATDPLGLVPVTGSTGAVGMAGLTLGGGYGPLIGRFGLALDNLVSAEIVLADGRVVVARADREEELFWALRGGGGNFGVITEMQHRLHALSEVRSGMLLFPFAEAKAVLRGCADICAFAPDELTCQLAFVAGPDGSPVAMVVPTWSGQPERAEAQLAPFLRLGTLLLNTVSTTSYKASLTAFDAHIVNGQRVLMETCWLPALDHDNIDVFIRSMARAVSPGCALLTHEFKGAASRVPAAATAFGLRRDHVLVEIIASFADDSDQAHQQWVQATLDDFKATALPGGYPNFLPSGDPRAATSYGENASRLAAAKRRYDPDNFFRSAIPLPIGL
jgi:FAD/FMN-containing dehydrogenase